MKKEVTEIKDVCDLCEKELASYKCLECGIDMCHKCIREGKAIRYEYAISMSNTKFDGFYCEPCNKKLKESKDNDLYQTYIKIQELGEESRAITQDIKDMRALHGLSEQEKKT